LKLATNDSSQMLSSFWNAIIVPYYKVQNNRCSWYSAVHPLARYALRVYVNVNENVPLPEVKPKLQPTASVTQLSEDEAKRICCHM
jgi:hypothetical protein